MVFHWILSDSKSPQVSRSLHTILADLKNDIVWMILASRLISNSSSNPFHSFADRSQHTNYNWSHRHPDVTLLFKFSEKV